MIITHTDLTETQPYAFLNIFPDQFKTEKEKDNKSWVKNTLDYFANVAFSQYKKNTQTFVKNYDLVKGIIKPEDFYIEQEVDIQSFIDKLVQQEDLPGYVRHYPILNPPLNTMIGELSKRPDIHKVRAFDDNSKSEELTYKTEIAHKFILQEAQRIIQTKLAISGQDISQLSEEDLSNLSFEEVKDSLTDYTSIAERWANKMLECLKAELNTKEQGEEAFGDLLTASREFFHIFEDNSKRGFNGEVVNPKNIWKLGLPDVKDMSGYSGKKNTPYAIGTMHVMEISQIIDECPDLTEDEIQHLRKVHQDYGIIDARHSNTFHEQAGQDSIKYDTYNRLVLQERMLVEASMKENKDELKDWMGLSNSTSAFGYKYSVVRAYWMSKKKVGRLTYITENGDVETIPVDEHYKEGSPNEIAIEWFWINQPYQGIRIGPDIFHVKPFELLPYLPIIGVVHGIKNTTAKSLVDLMKPYQTLYNICMNQLYELLEKEIGNVARVSLRRVPKPKDGSSEDAIDVWEAEARARGILFDDDSPENTKGAVSNQTVAGNVDLTRTNEIQSRYNLAAQLKAECWELIGMNRQRLGAPLATETATANQNALVQSFAQTEPYFSAHQNVMNQYYQALLDAAQYIESKKPISSLTSITSFGDSSFLQVAGDDLKLRDLKVFVTSKPEDQQLLNELRQLSQPALQNGASLYEVSKMYSTNSIRTLEKMFKDMEERTQANQQQEQGLQQQALEQEQKQHDDLMAQEEQHHQDELQMKKYEIDMKANTDITKAEISTFFQAPETDANNNGTPDIMELANHNLKIQESIAKRDLEGRNIALQMQKFIEEKKQNTVNNKLAEQKLKNEKEKLKIAKKKPAAKK